MKTRREALLSGLWGAGAVGLRALATGLPTWYLLDPRRASAQTLQCAVQAKDKLQYLIVNVASNGDPINCNCPGTYVNTSAIHPQQAEMAATNVQLGSKTFQAAQPWASTANGGQLDPSVLSRMCFFHHMTRSTVHGDQPKVMKLQGLTAGGEMMVSAYAKHLGPCFGTVQPAPISVGAAGNATELISYEGRTLPSISPTQLKQLLGGSSNNPLVNLRSIRDSSLNELYALAKQDGTKVQQQFLDAFATTQTQVRALSSQLSSTLSSISSDNLAGQALAAAALIAANVTSVVAVRIPFGGDNHSDNNLQNEADQHVSGVQGIQAVMSALSSLSLTDKVTFATWNVFGRNLNGIDKVTNRQGRDHYGNHSIGVMIGKNVAPGVVGGVAPLAGGSSSSALAAADIDSTTGSATAGADIPAADTQVAYARTLGVALGLPADLVAGDLVSSAGGKVVKAALNGVG
jgi:Protein of unknown function (DUF1501)